MWALLKLLVLLPLLLFSEAQNITDSPTDAPTDAPTFAPTDSPTANPTLNPTTTPTANPTANPTLSPTLNPTLAPTLDPTANPTISPTLSPTDAPFVRFKEDDEFPVVLVASAAAGVCLLASVFMGIFLVFVSTARRSNRRVRRDPDREEATREKIRFMEEQKMLEKEKKDAQRGLGSKRINYEELHGSTPNSVKSGQVTDLRMPNPQSGSFSSQGMRDTMQSGVSNTSSAAPGNYVNSMMMSDAGGAPPPTTTNSGRFVEEERDRKESDSKLLTIDEDI